jgi:prephenate dehydrogenase
MGLKVQLISEIIKVQSHSIVSTDFSGPKATIEILFKGKTIIVCEIEKTAYKKRSSIRLFSKFDHLNSI